MQSTSLPPRKKSQVGCNASAAEELPSVAHTVQVRVWGGAGVGGVVGGCRSSSWKVEAVLCSCCRIAQARGAIAIYMVLHVTCVASSHFS